MNPRLPAAAAWALVASSLLVIAAVTMPGLSTGGSSGAPNWTPGAGIASSLDNVDRSLGLLNILGNVLMFVPLGFSLVLTSSFSAPLAAVACAAVSVTIEVVQYGNGRSLDVDDVLLNAIGGAIGALLAVGALAAVRRLHPSARVPAG